MSLGLIGFMGFMGLIGFVGSIGFVGFVGFAGFIGFIGLVGFLVLSRGCVRESYKLLAVEPPGGLRFLVALFAFSSCSLSLRRVSYSRTNFAN